MTQPQLCSQNTGETWEDQNNGKEQASAHLKAAGSGCLHAPEPQDLPLGVAREIGIRPRGQMP